MDLSHLERLFKGDRMHIREWMALYLEESPAYFAQLADSCARGDAQALATAAHDLQPQAHYLGSERMLELLVAIEERALRIGTGACGELLTALQALRDTVERELRCALDAD